MDNFDFTQFISFDSDLPYEEIQNVILKLFTEIGFSIVKFEEIEKVKKEYYSDYWKKYSFELKKDDFLSDFMEWETIENIPNPVIEFSKKIDELLRLKIKGLRLIICSFAEKQKTDDEVVYVNHEKIFQELYKMSAFSFKSPDNIIINIVD